MAPDKMIPDEMINSCARLINDSKKHFFMASKYDETNEVMPSMADVPAAKKGKLSFF